MVGNFETFTDYFKQQNQITSNFKINSLSRERKVKFND